MSNAFGYVRVSGRGQMDGDGPERQKQAITKFCHGHSLHFAGFFIDGGVTGSLEAMDRPQFSEMMRYIEDRLGSSDEISTIVVERLDRLARDLMVQEMLFRECRRRGIKVYAADHGEVDLVCDDGDPTRKLIRQVMGALAEWEKSSLVRKLRVARDRKRAATGRCEGFAPFTDRPENKGLAPYICALYQGGQGIREIRRQLAVEQVPGPKGGGWNERTIHAILRRNGVAMRPAAHKIPRESQAGPAPVVTVGHYRTDPYNRD